MLIAVGAGIAGLAVTHRLRGDDTRRRSPSALSPGGPTDITNAAGIEPNGAAVTQVSTVSDQPGLAVASSNDAELASDAATVLWPVELSPFDTRKPATIDPGTLVTVLASVGGRATVQLPNGTEGYVAACALTGDGGELAIARALAGTQNEKEAARKGLSSAVLAPLLDGKPPSEVRCAKAAETKNAAAEKSNRTSDPKRVEALGLWTRRYRRVDAPPVHDWVALARAHGAIADDVPLRPAERQKVRILRQRELAAEGEELMGLTRPGLEYEVPAAELKGAYYAFGPTAVERATNVRLRGEVLLSVDCRGCEEAPRFYSGYADPQLATSIDAAAVLWVSAATALEAPHPLPLGAWTVASGKPIEIRLPLPARREPVAYTLPDDDRSRGKTIDGVPFAIRRAYLTGFPSLGIRLLVVETNGNDACSRGLFVYEVTENALRPLGGSDFDCDV